MGGKYRGGGNSGDQRVQKRGEKTGKTEKENCNFLRKSLGVKGVTTGRWVSVKELGGREGGGTLPVLSWPLVKKRGPGSARIT